jgi:dTDP-glucose 4,6-dehydratase
MAYHQEHGVETRIVRIFNTYGPRMRLHDGRVVPAVISQALKNKPITVVGKGPTDSQLLLRVRPDRRHLRLMMSNYSLPVNIGNPHRDDRTPICSRDYSRHRVPKVRNHF